MEENSWDVDINVNAAQLQIMLLEAKKKYIIYGRGTGKSFINGYDIDENVRQMPRGITAVVQSTFGQALTKTLPSTFKFLDKLGYVKYESRKKPGDYRLFAPPAEGWYSPMEHILSYENSISFANGHTLVLLSQNTNSRGPNSDYILCDEALTLKKDRFDEEVVPTNRGNEELFGFLSKKKVTKHHGYTFTTSMPYTQEQKWLLDPAKYYEEEKGIRIFEIWNKIVRLQIQLIDAKIQNDVVTFKEIWNETQRLRRTMTPFVSKDGTLFALANAFDNIHNLGMSYLVNQYNIMDLMTFMVEMLNYYIEKVDDCYYSIDERHIYYNATDDSYIRDFAENNSFDWAELGKPQSRFDLDCDTSKPIEITPDWHSNIALFEVAQERFFDFVTKEAVWTDNNINEFYVKQSEVSDTMINELVDQFCAYYSNHVNKRIIFYRDRYGDSQKANSKKSYNEHAIDRFKAKGWTVETRVHGGMEPPHHEKFLLWQIILKQGDTRYPRKRFNGSKCKYTLISMNNTRVKENSQGKFEKDKSSERKKSIQPEEATHFGDAVDKRIWTKYSTTFNRKDSFIPNRL